MGGIVLIIVVVFVSVMIRKVAAVALLRKYGIDERNLWIPHLGRVMK